MVDLNTLESFFEVEPKSDSDLPPVLPEWHRKRHFPEAEVLATLSSAGLECLSVYGHHYDAVLQPLDEGKHTKAVYIARMIR